MVAQWSHAEIGTARSAGKPDDSIVLNKKEIANEPYLPQL